MFSVYVLYSIRHDKIYIGYTSQLENRMLAHNFLSRKGWTRKFRPWILIYYEDFETKVQAARRERTLKNGKMRKRIRENFIRHRQYLQWLADKRRQNSSSGSYPDSDR